MSRKKTESKCGVKIKPMINSPFPFLRKNRHEYETGYLFILFFLQENELEKHICSQGKSHGTSSYMRKAVDRQPISGLCMCLPVT